jgi:2-aminoethylphosphonate-pyruvate transaminase
MSHREAEFSEVLARVSENMVKVLNGEGTHDCVPFVASGTGANEAVLAAVHGKLLVVVAGRYSERIGSIAQRLQVPMRRVDFPPLDGIEVDGVAEILRRDPEITHVFVVHHETTTGVLAPLRELGDLAARHRVLLLVDGISSIGGHPFDLERDNVAFCTINSNKCLESVPGLSFVVARTEEIRKLKGRSRSFYFDIYQQWERCTLEGKPPFTAAVQLFFAMDVALQRLMAEGYEGRVRRYRQLKERLALGLESLGLRRVPISPARQANVHTLLYLPPGTSYQALHDKMRERGITIYSDRDTIEKGMFFIATMGAITSEDVDYFLDHLAAALGELGHRPVPVAAQ